MKNNDTLKQIIFSSLNKKGNVNSTEYIIKWIQNLNSTLEVKINKASLQESDFWYFDKEKGEIKNKNSSFFSIKGIRQVDKNGDIYEQPVIVQNEIGYLGIICKEIDGVLNFLMQAKIEPGNVNKIQISPTIQATKSNFMQKHGGNRPNYIGHFIEADKYEIIVDQIQSEQSSRFYKKRNRNIIIKITNDIEVLNNYKWMTIGQIKELLKINNLVNMDTRTVLSCIPYSMNNFNECDLKEISKLFSNNMLFKSAFYKPKENMLPQIYSYINNYKMFNETTTELIRLNDLKSWKMKNDELVCDREHPFKVIFCDIMIEGREVRRWNQPLFEANGKAIFGLFICEDEGEIKFLIKLKPEIGCFDMIEIGPTVQIEANENLDSLDYITRIFIDKWNKKDHVCNDVILSEEGGRFYYEENHNIIIKIKKEDIREVDKGYFWVDYYTLNLLIQINNCVNIQLRNLISLMEV